MNIRRRVNINDEDKKSEEKNKKKIILIIVNFIHRKQFFFIRIMYTPTLSIKEENVKRKQRQKVYATKGRVS